MNTSCKTLVFALFQYDFLLDLNPFQIWGVGNVDPEEHEII